MQHSSQKYTLRISRLTIDKMGIQMYDRVSAVLAELIANAYDADATQVKITLPFGHYLARRVEGQVEDQGFKITIEDNGCGMTAQEVNAYYLNVGYNRRVKRSERTPKYNRQVMGRKGIGKLAPFGICREVEVKTAGGPLTDRGYAVSNLILNLDEILDDNGNNDANVSSYHPKLGPQDGDFAISPGTTLTLRRFDRRRVPIREELDRQLSARFGLSQSEWSVWLEDSIGKEERIELGSLNVDVMPDTRISVDDKPVIFGDRRLPVSGWVAYAKDPYKDEVMAGVRIYARGKIVAQTRDFDIKTGFTGEFKMRSYLTGAIHAEWLDKEEDFIRTDRQDIIWNSELGASLREWGRELLRKLAATAETSTRQRAWDRFLEQSHLDERLEVAHPKDRTIRDSVLSAARALVTRADRDSIENSDYVDRMVRLAYAIGPHRTLLDTLNEVATREDEATDVILELFDRARLVEIYSLGQVAQERVDAVEQLKGLIANANTQERELQKLLEGAPWIIYPDWTPLSNNQALATTRTNFENWYHTNFQREISTSAIANPTKQPDFVLLNHLGRLEIFEIKRPKHRLTDEEFDRAFNYLTAMRKYVEESDDVKEQFPTVKLTFVCDGLNLSTMQDRLLETDPGVNKQTWHALLQTTSRSHEDFLAVVGKLQGELPRLATEGEEA